MILSWHRQMPALNTEFALLFSHGPGFQDIPNTIPTVNTMKGGNPIGPVIRLSNLNDRRPGDTSNVPPWGAHMDQGVHHGPLLAGVVVAGASFFTPSCPFPAWIGLRFDMAAMAFVELPCT